MNTHNYCPTCFSEIPPRCRRCQACGETLFLPWAFWPPLGRAALALAWLYYVLHPISYAGWPVLGGHVLGNTLGDLVWLGAVFFGLLLILGSFLEAVAGLFRPR